MQRPARQYIHKGQAETGCRTETGAFYGEVVHMPGPLNVISMQTVCTQNRIGLVHDNLLRTATPDWQTTGDQIGVNVFQIDGFHVLRSRQHQFVLQVHHRQTEQHRDS